MPRLAGPIIHHQRPVGIKEVVSFHPSAPMLAFATVAPPHCPSPALCGVLPPSAVRRTETYSTIYFVIKTPICRGATRQTMSVAGVGVHSLVGAMTRHWETPAWQTPPFHVGPCHRLLEHRNLVVRAWYLVCPHILVTCTAASEAISLRSRIRIVQQDERITVGCLVR